MKYPRIHQIRRARRNAAAPPTITVAAKGDFIKMRIDQLRQFRKLRGTFKTTEALPTEKPYAVGAPAFQTIPRTTNADIKTIVNAWDEAFRTYAPRSQRLGGSHNKKFEKTHRTRWKHTKKQVAKLIRGQPGAAEFSRNPEFWTIWLTDIAAYLSERQQGRPARMDIIADALEQSVDELPETLANAAEAAAEAASNAASNAADVAGKGLSIAGSWLKWGAVAAGGFLLVPPIVRTLREPTKDRNRK